MKSWKITVIASLVGTAVGVGAWIFGLGQLIWPAHPQITDFLLTLVATIAITITWPRPIAANPR